MEIKKFIKIYDEVLPLNILSNLIRFGNVSKFCVTTVGNANTVDLNIRKANSLPLSNLDNSLSIVHWFNILQFIFNRYLRQYKIDLNIVDYEYQKIFDIEILQYLNTGFYTWHVDHFATVPRTMSCILLLNNDYEGGNLCFRNPDGSGEWEVEVKPNRMIIWPSNFLYPHTVKPVTKGTRYSVVAWAL